MTSWEPGTFDFSDASEPETPTWTVAEIGAAISKGLRVQFPDSVWITGEIQGFKKPNKAGHCYFDLVEPGAGPGERPAAVMAVSLFNRDRRRVDATLLQSGADATLTNGMEVRIYARVNWWVEGGRLNLVMSDIDPTFTFGQLDARRRQLLEALRVEGLLRRNATVPMPLLPLRIGLITSAGSAAHADFVHELEASGYRFVIELVDTRVQGAEAPAGVVHALTQLRNRPIDVVAVVRGGGSVTDLAAFDHEDIARTIATFDLPVITGIGHEIDRAVADEVAAISAKTPTAAAAHLVNIVRGVDTDRVNRVERLVRLSSRRLSENHQHVAIATRALARAARVAAARADDQLRVRSANLGRAAHRDLTEQTKHLDAAVKRLTQRSALHQETARAGQRLRAQKLQETSTRTLTRIERAIDARAAQVRAHDPALVLARGWSVTRTVDGVIVRDAATVAPGTEIVTTLATGTVASTVTNTISDS